MCDAVMEDRINKEELHKFSDCHLHSGGADEDTGVWEKLQSALTQAKSNLHFG